MIEIIPLYPLAAVVFLGAGALFALQMARHLRVFATARPVTVTDRVETRFESLVRYALVQIRMFRDPASGMSHLVIFWGFIILSLGTLDRIFYGLVHEVVSWPLEGWLWRLLLLTQNLLMVGVLGAVAFSVGRRVLARPRRMTLSRDGVVILLLIGGVVITELLTEAFRIAGRDEPDAAWAFAANALAVPLAAILDSQALDIGYTTFFWANVLIISFFLAYLPRSKHLHIATAFFNTAFRKLAPRGQLPAMDLEAEDARFGVKTVTDLGWKDLLDGFTCTECGRCQDACPAWGTGKPLNPKTMIMGLRELSVEAESGIGLLPWIRPKDAPGRHGGTT